MEAIKWSQYSEGYYEAPEEDLMLLVEKETMEGYPENYDEPGYFFKGAAIGLIFCVPFWTIIFWLII